MPAAPRLHHPSPRPLAMRAVGLPCASGLRACALRAPLRAGAGRGARLQIRAQRSGAGETSPALGRLARRHALLGSVGGLAGACMLLGPAGPVSAAQAEGAKVLLTMASAEADPPQAVSAPGARSEGGLAAPRKVFVAGATGRTGERIVRALVARGIAVQAGVRSPEKAAETFQDLDTSKVDFVKFDVLAGVDALSAVIDPSADAIVVATGFAPTPGTLPNPLLPWQVDNYGTVNLVDAARRLGIGRLVLVSSLLTNGAAWGQALNPAYIVLNLFGLVLVAKLQAERYIQRSGINYTIVRPGGLKSDGPSGNIVASGEDTLASGSISRTSVAEVAVEALLWPEASYKIVEIIETSDSPKKSFKQLFADVPPPTSA